MGLCPAHQSWPLAGKDVRFAIQTVLYVSLRVVGLCPAHQSWLLAGKDGDLQSKLYCTSVLRWGGCAQPLGHVFMVQMKWKSEDLCATAACILKNPWHGKDLVLIATSLLDPLSVCVHTYVHACVRVTVCLCLHSSSCVCACACQRVPVFVSVCRCVCACTQVWACMHTCMHVCEHM